MERENTFQIPAIKSDYFGMLNPPAYAHEFELKYIFFTVFFHISI